MEFDPRKRNAISVFAFGEQWGHDREALFAEPTNLDINWGKELKDFSMEQTWNFITSTAVLRKSFGRTRVMLAVLKCRERGDKEPWWGPCPQCSQKQLFQSQCGRNDSCSHEAGLMNLSRQFFYQVTGKEMKTLLLAETGGLFELGQQRGRSPTPAGALLFPKPHPSPHLDYYEYATLTSEYARI